MSVTENRGAWTWEAYVEWEARQEARFELIDGGVHAMTGRSQAHDRIANNLRAALWAQLQDGPCLPYGPDLKVRAGRNGRYPDALVDRGRHHHAVTVAEDPVAVFEVLSRSRLIRSVPTRHQLPLPAGRSRRDIANARHLQARRVHTVDRCPAGER